MLKRDRTNNSFNVFHELNICRSSNDMRFLSSKMIDIHFLNSKENKLFTLTNFFGIHYCNVIVLF